MEKFTSFWIPLLLLKVNYTSAEKPASISTCNDMSRTGISGAKSSLTQWVKSAAPLVNKDQEISAYIEDMANNLNKTDLKTTEEHFYRFISTTMETPCKVGKWFAINNTITQ